MKPTGQSLLAWGKKTLAPDTFERTLAAAWADLEHELAHAPDAATAAKLARSGRGLMARVLVGALAEDRRVARRGVRWWLLAFPLLAALVGVSGLTGTSAGGAQLVFLAIALGLGVVMAGTPRRVLAHEAPAVAWIAVFALVIGPRWLPIGPLHLHLATLLMPFIVLGFSRLLAERRVLQGLAMLAAAQAGLMTTLDFTAALTLGVTALAITAPRLWLMLASAAIAAAALAVTRADPLLAPAPYLPHGLALLPLAAAALAPLTTFWRSRDAWARGMSAAVALGLATPLCASALIVQDLPLIDFGGSAVVAAFLGLGALLSLERGAPSARAQEAL